MDTLCCVSGAPQIHNYPNRAELVGSMAPLLKAARRPLPSEWEDTGLDPEGWDQLDLVANKLARHLHFEYLELKDLRNILHDAVLRYRATSPTERPNGRDVAESTFDAIAREPLHKTVYLGIEHLRLPHGSVVGDVRFVDPSLDPSLLNAFGSLGRPIPALVCEVEVVAGTPELLRDRARAVAETALALLRQQNLFGFGVKIFTEQVLYRLDGTWTWRDDGATARAGWWRENPRPNPMDLTHSNGEAWRTELSRLADLYVTVPPDLRSRVDTCLDWLDVAALSDRWRIIIPAIFSAMEALLVPEPVGLKAALVTVRSAAVHVALDHAFFDPGDALAGYHLRSDLVHGTPTGDVLGKAATDFALRLRRWAFQVLSDYLQLVQGLGTTNVLDLVSQLDRGKCIDVCTWLEVNGGQQIVDEYTRAVPARRTTL